MKEVTTVEITEKDIEALVTMIEDLYANYGRAIVHGDANDDSPRDVVENILSDTLRCGVYRWAAKHFPARYAKQALHPDLSGFPDDEEMEALYAEYGFNH